MYRIAEEGQFAREERATASRAAFCKNTLPVRRAGAYASSFCVFVCRGITASRPIASSRIQRGEEANKDARASLIFRKFRLTPNGATGGH